MTKIKIIVGSKTFSAELYDTATGNAIKEALPFKSSASTWGDEIYFSVSADADLEPGAQAAVQVGELAYWPSMPAFCIFFGPTPVSTGDQPVAASPVNVFGKLDQVDLDELRNIRGGEQIEVAEDNWAI
ncbi:MAG: hypothetical protein JXQ96_05725 [Cyclobacteriaceae bacterium]